MHLIVTIDLGSDMFQCNNPGAEVARILRDTAQRLSALHDSKGALHHENPEQLYLLDSTGAMVDTSAPSKSTASPQPGKTGSSSERPRPRPAESTPCEQ